MQVQPSFSAVPNAIGLYDPSNEHDACGVGFIAHIKGQEYLNAYFEFDKIIDDGNIKYAFFDSFTDMMENVEPNTVISNFKHYRFCNSDTKQQWDQLKEIDAMTVWGTKKGQALNKVLMNCRNECWDCHACEKTFGAPSFDSLVEVNRDVSFLRGHSDHFNGFNNPERGE